LLEEIVERVVLRNVGHSRDRHFVFGDFDVALDVDADDGRAHLLHQVGEAQRCAAEWGFNRPLGDGRLFGSGLGDSKRHAIAER
jgi:hypothetical protein